MSAGVVVRRGGAQDIRFLRDMLHHAYYWKERRPDAGPGPVQLYVKAFGRPGDTVVIALSDGFPVGAAWYRLFRAVKPGYGFVDERTPELAIAVVPNARGKGVGGALLDALLERARADGHQAVLVVPVQFIADHLEILYDIDVAARGEAEEAGLAFNRIELLNTSPAFIRALADVALDQERSAQPTA